MDTTQKPKITATGRLLRDSVAFYKAHFSALAWYVALLAIIELLNAFGSRYLQTSLDAQAASGGTHVAAFITYGIILLVVLVFGILAGIALLKNIFAIEDGKATSVKQMFKDSAHLFWSFILITLILIFVFYGAAVLLIIPAIMMFIYVGFSTFILIDQDKKGFKALTTSWNYVRGYWWAVFGRYVMLCLVCALIYAVVFAVSGIVFHLAGLSIFEATSAKQAAAVNFSIMHPVAFTIYTCVNLIVLSFIIAPIAAIYQTKIYRSLVAIKSAAPVDPAAEASNTKEAKIWSMVFMVIGIIVIVAYVTIFIFLFRTGKLSQALDSAAQNSGAYLTATTTASGAPATLYEDANKTFEITLDQGFTGSSSVSLPDATIFSNQSEDISEGVIVVAPIAYTTDTIDAYTNATEQQELAAGVKTQLTGEGVTIVASNLTKAPFSYEYTKAAGVDDQETSIHAMVYMYFGYGTMYLVAPETSQDNWASSSPSLKQMALSFIPLQ